MLTENNEFLNFSEKEKKRIILQNIPEDLEGDMENYLPVKGLIYQLFLELMLVDLSIKDPNLKRFIKYLQTIKTPVPLLRDAVTLKIN